MNKRLFLVPTVSAFLVVGVLFFLKSSKPTDVITNFDDCAKERGSVIQESYPAVCVTRDGRRFNQGDQQVPPLPPTPTSSPDAKGLECTSHRGTWDQKYKECTGIDKKTCEQNGGSFNECASACRHSTDPNAPCIMICVQVCQY